MNARQRVLIPFTIANGVALSGEVNVGGGILVGIIAPSAWTAAGLSLQALVSETAGVPTYGEVLTDASSTAWGITAITAGAYYGWAMTAALAVAGAGRVRVRSGTSGTPVNQGAARTGYLVVLI